MTWWVFLEVLLWRLGRRERGDLLWKVAETRERFFFSVDLVLSDELKGPGDSRGNHVEHSHGEWKYQPNS